MMRFQKRQVRRSQTHEVTWKLVLGLLYLPTIIAILLAVAFILLQRHTAFADGPRGYNTNLVLRCAGHDVTEGDDFELVVERTENMSIHRALRVFWSTTPMSASESDYEPLHSEVQTGTPYETEVRRMAHTFQTTEDPYSEREEIFKVGFSTSERGPETDHCGVRILDNDPVGFYRMEMFSSPKSGNAYAAGEMIEIAAYFTGDVSTQFSGSDGPADYTGIHILVGDERKVARFLRGNDGNGGNRIIFGYEVQEGDTDTDGISVEAGDPDASPPTGWVYGGEGNSQVGLWTVDSGRTEKVNLFYRGTGNKSRHKVDA